MVLADTFRQAYRTVAGNKLRTGITVSIIAFGIMALIGIITAIQAMNSSVNSNFATMGANGFTLTYKEHRRFGNQNNNVSVETRGRKQKKSTLDKYITLAQAESFKQQYSFPATVSIALNSQQSYEIHYGEKKTNPNAR